LVADVALTPPRLVELAVGVFVLDQAMPSQCRARLTEVPALVSVPPTAQALPEDSALTPLRKLAPVLLGLGLLTFDQDVPFQCTISVLSDPDAPIMYPAAQMSVFEVPLTPVKTLTTELGFGVFTFDQVEPFQWRINVSSTPHELVVQ
jgi:hypothetical protein